ncbi:IS256 family transposase [Carboxydothermus pertinax]|uniref:Mutator family transposase n=1 Tax=Carboxydothermus pertinax TaxID=870242 RepID=A0A1L8CTQ2_9THEO|nr:IS256 family transposase [Carboxydothermus pertinax]
MAQYNITIDSEILHHLFLNGAKNEGVAKLLESVLNQILQAQAKEQIKADPYERADERQDYRNGYYPRNLVTRVGTLTLRVPRLREGKFTTDIFRRYQRSEQALLLALMEMVFNGVSTRKIEEITYEFCGTEFSKSTISELCKNLDPIVTRWNLRPLREKSYLFIIVDAMVIRVREDGRVRQQGVLIAIGVNEGGYREILGIMLGDSESEKLT